MARPELAAVSFIATILVLIPFSWHWRARNIATITTMLWLAWGNLTHFINAILWKGNVIVKAQVYCDICKFLSVERRSFLFTGTDGQFYGQPWLFIMQVHLVYQPLHSALLAISRVSLHHDTRPLGSTTPETAASLKSACVSSSQSCTLAFVSARPLFSSSRYIGGHVSKRTYSFIPFHTDYIVQGHRFDISKFLVMHSLLKHTNP